MRLMARGVEKRLMWEDGRWVPRSGDLARILEDVTLGGGGKLRADQNVLVTIVLEEVPVVVGIKWRDKHGTHVIGDARREARGRPVTLKIARDAGISRIVEGVA